MKKYIFSLTAIFFVVFSFLSIFPAYADDLPFSGGGGATGTGNFDNGWIISTGQSDLDGIRVYLVQGGVNAKGEEIGSGHMIKEIETINGRKILKALDLSNHFLPTTNIWNGNGKIKSDYRYNNLQLGGSGWSSEYTYIRLSEPNKLKGNNSTNNGTVVGWGETEDESKKRIEEIKYWFTKEGNDGEKTNIKLILNLFGTTELEVIKNQWYIAFEPVIYFRYYGQDFALTPTECAVYNKHLISEGKQISLAGRMGPLTHQNAPLSIYPTEDMFAATGYRFPEWKQQTTNKNLSDTDIINSLGIGYRKPPLPPTADSEIIINSLIATPKKYEVKNDKLGTNATIKVNLSQSTAVINEWKDRLDDDAKIDVYMRMTSPDNRALTCTTAGFTNFSGDYLTKKFITLTKTQFINLLQQSSLTFTDNCTNKPITDGENINYEYSFQLAVSFKESMRFTDGGKVKTVSSNLVSDYANFFKNPNTVINMMDLKADPKDYEVKGAAGKPATLGKNATITVNLKQSDEDIDKWKNRLDNNAQIQVSMRLKQTEQNRQLTCITSGYERFSGAALINQTITLTKTEFINLLKKSSLKFTDICTSQKINAGETIEYNYVFSLTVSFVESSKFGNGGKTQTVTACNGTKTQISDYASFFRKKELPETVNYTSTPETYAEIKQGTIGNEEFEAMAGTPTTRDLYFGVGGSEFVVDFEAQLLKNKTATRTYRVHYDGIECEFKEGDQSKNFTFPAPTGGGSGNYSISSMHNGGSCSVTWSGTTKYTGTPVFNADKTSVSLTEVWDDAAYDAAKAAASAYAASVNGTVYSYTAASDKETRTKSGWGAGITADSNTHIKGSVTQGSPEVKEVKDKDGKVTTPYKAKVEATYTLGSDNSWTITVSWTVPAHTCCGPCHTHDLPAVNDTWTQEISYDYFDITKAAVWKIEQGYLDGLSAITGTNSVLTSILQGSSTIFSNIAATETSKDGRFRYSVEPQMHDAVVWNKGARSNKCDKQSETWGTGIKYNVTGYPHEAGYLVSNASAKDKLTAEYAEFKLNREKLIEVTVISDLLVLQTSSGDQSVLYFEKKSNKVQTQVDYAPIEVSKSEAWDNNTKSAAKWTPSHINTGSYNGNFVNTSGKYNGSGSNNKIATMFDNDPANTITRTARPSSALRIAKYGIDVIDTLPNNDYTTGTAITFWELKLNYNPDNKKVNKKTEPQPLFGGKQGIVLNANYSQNHFKINDIVIHNPVSSEYAMILSLSENRDQRAAGTVKWAERYSSDNSECPGSSVLCEFRHLNCKYTGTSYHTVNCYTAVTAQTLNTHDHTVNCVDTAKLQQAFQPITGTHTFNYTGNVQTFTAPATGTYTLEVWGAQGGGNIGGSGGYAKGTYNLIAGQTINIYVGGQSAGTSGGWNGGGSSASYEAKGGGGATDIRVGGTSSANRVIVAGGGGGAGFYGVGSINGGGSGEYQGGIGGGVNGGAGTGAYAAVGFGGSSLISDTGIGASGQGGGGGGGYNGGGAGSFASASGVDWGGSFYSSGGGGSGYIGGVNGGTMQSGVNSGNGKAVISYHLGNQGTTWGLVGLDEILVGGNIQVSNEWLAKQPVNAQVFKCGNAPYNRHVCDASCSHTAELICDEPHHTGEHYDITDETCWSACGNHDNHKKKTTAATGSSASGQTAGYFINLDWGFEVYFPTVGDFYQNGTYGISTLTNNRGKGFVNNMETAEWVAKKRVMFAFDVIYCGASTSVNANGLQHGNAANGSDNHKHTGSCKLYKAGEWVDLPKDYELFNFYCVASNDETAATRTMFEVTAINSPSGANDNDEATNRYRNLALEAKHGAIKTAYTDIIGRIGNLVMEDTGDYRLSNLFKTPVAGNTADDYIVQGIIKNVDINSKNYVLAGNTDIRGLLANSAYKQDTYGLLSWLRSKTLTFPLSPAKNNIQALKNEPLRVGYHVYLDIETLGSDYGNIEVKPYYYYYDLNSKTAVPLDVYINAPSGYEPINLFGNTDLNKVYSYNMVLDWSEQSKRRNVTENEQLLTQTIAALTGREQPSGAYLLGTAQYLSFGEKARTYIGSSSTLGVNQNIGGLISSSDFSQSVKRWHFTLGLPSSAVFVDSGASPTEANIAKYKNSSGVILLAADITAQSGLYKLAYGKEADGYFQIGNTSYPLPNDILNVIAVYNGDGKTSRDDIEIHKTH